MTNEEESDAVRKEKAQRARENLRRMVEEEGITEEELLQEGKKIRGELFDEFFGDE